MCVCVKAEENNKSVVRQLEALQQERQDFVKYNEELQKGRPIHLTPYTSSLQSWHPDKVQQFAAYGLCACV